jgi:hypothetical protein
MVERILLRRMREKLSEAISLCEKVYEEWYRKCDESISRGNLTLYGYSKLLEDMQKRIGDFLLLMERLAKLEKELFHLDAVDEATKALAYSIMELSEEERREVFEFIKNVLERRVGE